MHFCYFLRKIFSNVSQTIVFFLQTCDKLTQGSLTNPLVEYHFWIIYITIIDNTVASVGGGKPELSHPEIGKCSAIFWSKVGKDGEILILAFPLQNQKSECLATPQQFYWVGLDEKVSWPLKQGVKQDLGFQRGKFKIWGIYQNFTTRLCHGFLKRGTYGVRSGSSPGAR